MTRRAGLLGAAVLACFVAGVRPAHAVDLGREADIDVWMDRDEGSVYEPGDELSVYVRLSRSSYVAVYDVDTSGRLRLLYPTSEYDDRRLRRDETYRLPRQRGDDYVVSGPEGVEYIYVVASDEPLFDRLPWNHPYDVDEDGDRDWYTEVQGDPFTWCGRVNDYILGDDPSGASTYTYFYVERRVAYPRYLCFECHGQGYYAGSLIHPYRDRCSVFSVQVSTGWIFRSRPYSHRTCPPLYVYYRRDDCPPRWNTLPRYWSSANRREIRTRFADLHREPPRPRGGGGTAVEKDRDVRFKSPYRGGSRSSARRVWQAPPPPSRDTPGDRAPRVSRRPVVDEPRRERARESRRADRAPRQPVDTQDDRRVDDRTHARDHAPPPPPADRGARVHADRGDRGHSDHADHGRPDQGDRGKSDHSDRARDKDADRRTK